MTTWKWNVTLARDGQVCKHVHARMRYLSKYHSKFLNFDHGELEEKQRRRLHSALGSDSDRCTSGSKSILDLRPSVLVLIILGVLSSCLGCCSVLRGVRLRLRLTVATGRRSIIVPLIVTPSSSSRSGARTNITLHAPDSMRQDNQSGLSPSVRQIKENLSRFSKS